MQEAYGAIPFYSFQHDRKKIRPSGQYSVSWDKILVPDGKR